MPDQTLYPPAPAVVAPNGYAYDTATARLTAPAVTPTEAGITARALTRGYFPNCSCSSCHHARNEVLDNARIEAGASAWTCERCERPSSSPLTRTVGNVSICHTCLRNTYQYTCYTCDLPARYSQLQRTQHGTLICANCNVGYWECDDCTTLIDWGTYCDDCDPDNRDDDYCDCRECRSCDNSYIRSYDYRPLPRFHGDGPLYLGVELEIETAYGSDTYTECAELAATALGDLGYLKSDSSLDHGFEIVTHPMSHAWAATNFPWSMLATLQTNGARADSSAGLHIHVSRAGFSSPSHIYRWLKLLYRNPAGVIRVARRDSRQWASFDRGDVRENAKSYCKGERYGERYSAVNVQNRDTFELRVFASTLDETELRAAMDLAHASIEYTRTLSVSDIFHRDGWSWNAFTDWTNQRPEYTALTTLTKDALCAS